MSTARASDERPTLIGALEAIEQQYAALFGRNPDPIYALDVDGRLVSGNAALEMLTGYGIKELLGRSFLALLVPDDRTRARRHFSRALNGEAQSLEVSGTGRDGREFTIAMTSIPLVVDGTIEGVYGLAKDVTRRKEAERAVRETDERYHLLADNVQDMISLHDHTGVFVYASPSSYALLGMHPVELIGRSVYDLVEPEDVHLVVAAHQDILRREGRGPVAFRVRRADGAVGWFETTARVVHREDTTEPWRIVGVTRDITQRRAVEGHLVHSQKLEALGRLASGIAHDFNNTLTVISGHAQLLTDALTDRRERQSAEHIREAALRASSLARQLLTFGRAEKRSTRATDLNAVILELQPMLGRLTGDDIALNIDLEPHLASVHCEPNALQQIIVNLTANARDAMADGGRLTVGTQNVEVTDAGGPESIARGAYVLLTVTDTGVGMEPRVAERAFEPFFTTRPDSATGLGLSTVYSIAREAGGSVEVRSEPGKGTRFSLLLPAHAGAANMTADGRSTPTDSLRGTETIMVAEDDAGVRALVVAALQRYGYRVMTAVDGLQALELFRTFGHLIDLVVTDVNMPEMKGPELVEILTDEGTTLPVLYISGFTASSLELDEMAPRRAFLGKPFTPVELVQAVRVLLDEVTAQAAREQP